MFKTIQKFWRNRPTRHSRSNKNTLIQPSPLNDPRYAAILDKLSSEKPPQENTEGFNTAKDKKRIEKSTTEELHQEDLPLFTGLLASCEKDDDKCSEEFKNYLREMVKIIKSEIDKRPKHKMGGKRTRRRHPKKRSTRKH